MDFMALLDASGAAIVLGGTLLATVLGSGDDSALPSYGTWTLSDPAATNYFKINTNRNAPDESWVLRVTTAYESGFGWGKEHRGLVNNPYVDNSPEFIAWTHGYEVAAQRHPKLSRPSENND